MAARFNFSRTARMVLMFALLGTALGGLVSMLAQQPDLYLHEIGAALGAGWALYVRVQCQLVGHKAPDSTVTSMETATHFEWQCPHCGEMVSRAKTK